MAGGPTNGPTYRGAFPQQDESIERLINALSLYVASQGYSAMRTVSVDADGNYIAGGSTNFAKIDNASSGDNTLVSANATKKIRVTSLFLVSAGTVTVRFESGASGTALTGQMNLVVNTGFVLPYNPAGWFETAANSLLNLELSDAVSVDGSLSYILV